MNTKSQRHVNEFPVRVQEVRNYLITHCQVKSATKVARQLNISTPIIAKIEMRAIEKILQKITI